MVKIIEVNSINANGVKRQEHVTEANLEAYQIQIASEGFEVVNTAPAGHTQDTPQKPAKIAIPAELKNKVIIASIPEEAPKEEATQDTPTPAQATKEITTTPKSEAPAPSQDIETVVNSHLATMQSNPESLPDSLVDDILNPRFIIKMFTDKKRQKTYAPEIFTISKMDSDAVYCMSLDGKEYRYNRDNLGQIRIAKHGKGSASLNILASQRPTIDEIEALSKKLLEKVN